MEYHTKNTNPSIQKASFVIEDDVLNLFKGFLNEGQEFCGIFEIINNRLIPVDINIGETVEYNGGTREMCISPDSRYIWHTHPYISFSVPSTEDILHVVKHSDIYSSTIITAWGIWEIYKVENFYPNLVKDKKVLEYFFKEIQKIVDSLIQKTRIPRDKRINNYKNRTDLDNFIKDINKSITKINELLGTVINICFTSWENCLPF